MPVTAAKRFFSAFYRWQRHQAVVGVVPSRKHSSHSTPDILVPEKWHRRVSLYSKHQGWASNINDRRPHGVGQRGFGTYGAGQRRVDEKDVVEENGDNGTTPHATQDATEHSSTKRLGSDKSVQEAEFERHVYRGLRAVQSGGQTAEEHDVPFLVKKMMRNIPHPVVVVAATGVDPLNHERQIVQAMTVSSFTTVSLSPHAIISFNVKRPSRTLDAILSREAKAFQVKVLSDTPAGAQIADLMVRGTATAAVQDLKASGFEFNLDPPHGEESVLTLKGPGIWGELSCNTLVHKCISVADHVIVVAVVRKISLLDYDPTDVEVVEELHEKLLSRGTGLLYINGSYKSVGESLVPKVNENGSSPDDTLGVAVKDSSTHINVNMFRDIARREGSLHDENAYGHLRHAAWNHHRKGSPYPDALVLEALKE